MGASAEIRHGGLRDRRQTNDSRTRSDKRDGVRHRLPPQKRPSYETGVGRFVSRSSTSQMRTNIGGTCQKMHPRERGATSVAAAVADARRSHHPNEAAKAHLNNSSWLPVRSKKTTLSFDDQITSQSPEFATWHSLLPAQLPESRCILCRRLRISMDSGEFSRTRSIRLWSSTRSQLRRWAFFLRSRENAVENSAVNLPISASPLR